MGQDFGDHVDDCGVYGDDDRGKISDVQGGDVVDSGCAKGIDAEDDDLNS